MTAVGQNNDESVRLITAQSNKVQYPTNPIKIGLDFWSHRRLISQFTRREILQLYKGSFLGLSWTFVSPLLQTLVYTFVFAFIFRARYEDGGTGSRTEYALGLLAGLAAFEVFRFSFSTAPNQILRNANLVKKVVFPVEILSVSQLGPAITESLARVLILLLAVVILLNQLHWTTIFLPLIFLPLILLTLGVSWFVASIGVFVRDVRHLVVVIIRVLFFATPIFYSLASVPEPFRTVLSLNPLAIIVNHFRRVILWGEMPDWSQLLIVTAVSFLICWLGYLWFMKTRRMFADII